MKKAEIDGVDFVKHLRRHDEKVLKQVLEHISNDKIIRSVRKTMRERRESSNLYQHGYIQSLRTSTPTHDRDQLRNLLKLSRSQIDQFMNNGHVKQHVKKLRIQTTPKYESDWADTSTPRPVPGCVLHPAGDLLSRGSYIREQLSNENSIEEEPEDMHHGNNANTDTEHSPSDDQPHKYGSIQELTDSYITNRQNGSKSEEINSELYKNDSKISDTKKRHVRFNDDILMTRGMPAKVTADNLDEDHPDLIKVVFSDTEMKYNISKEPAFDVFDKHDETNKVKGVLSNKEQWQNRQADGDRNQSLRSYKLNETKPRMYESQSKENRAPKDAKDTLRKAKPCSAKSRELQHRITSAKTRYSRLIHSDVIRNENMDIQVRLENALPVVDSWNRCSLGTRHDDPMGDNHVAVAGSVVHYQQVRQENAENQARLSKTRSKICSWQSGQIMSLLTAGQTKNIKVKRNNLH